MKITSRQHVLTFLDKSGSEGRRLANEYRKENGLQVKGGCTRCNTKGHYYTCPASDRISFTCSNFTKRDEEKRLNDQRTQHLERESSW